MRYYVDKLQARAATTTLSSLSGMDALIHVQCVTVFGLSELDTT